MAKKGDKGRKVRVDFRANRQERARAGDLTRRYQVDPTKIDDSDRAESVRAKGALSRKRTIIVDDEQQTNVDQALWKRGVVTVMHGIVADVVDDSGQTWSCTLRRVLRTRSIDERAPLTVGDRVWFYESTKDGTFAQTGYPVGVIERVEPRQSVLSRRAARNREHTIVANADQLLAVVSLAQPALKPHLVDRYIVAAHKGNLRPILCFSKMDLLEGASEDEDSDLDVESDESPIDATSPPASAADAATTVDITDELTVDDDLDRAHSEELTIDHVIGEWRRLGYTCVVTSVRTNRGINELRELLKGHVTVVSGQSGVGKSSLLNAIEPGLGLVTQQVSTENEKGKHTTTKAVMIRLSNGGFVVDTPGVRMFDLWGVEPGELEACFAEFAPLVEHCKFADCSHRHEDGCAILDAVEAGRISARRYASYRKMFADA